VYPTRPDTLDKTQYFDCVCNFLMASFPAVSGFTCLLQQTQIPLQRLTFFLPSSGGPWSEERLFGSA
jgi:hypothetical protein